MDESLLRGQLHWYYYISSSTRSSVKRFSRNSHISCLMTNRRGEHHLQSNRFPRSGSEPGWLFWPWRPRPHPPSTWRGSPAHSDGRCATGHRWDQNLQDRSDLSGNRRESMERRAELTWGNVDTRVLGLRQGHIDDDLALRQPHLHPAVSQRGEHQQPAGVPRPEGQTGRQGVAVTLTRQFQERCRVEKDGEGVGVGAGKRQVALKWMVSEKVRDCVTQTKTWAPESKHLFKKKLHTGTILYDLH